jgi:hypothetical protein
MWGANLTPLFPRHAIDNTRFVASRRGHVSNWELPVLTRISYIVDVGVPQKSPQFFARLCEERFRDGAPGSAKHSGLVEPVVPRRQGATWAKCARMAWQQQGVSALPYRALRRTLIGDFSLAGGFFSARTSARRASSRFWRRWSLNSRLVIAQSILA